jgi:pimeloyl-ACP methyl ester carboxylesterase
MSTDAATDAATKPTIVLVHGAWADGSSWDAVTRSLQGQGYTVLVPPNPLRGLTEDAAYIASFLAQRPSGPVVLVGHSYGGAVITNAGGSGGDMRALVYVNAFVPDEGETVLQLLDGRARHWPSPTRRRCSTSPGIRGPRRARRRCS